MSGENDYVMFIFDENGDQVGLMGEDGELRPIPVKLKGENMCGDECKCKGTGEVQVITITSVVLWEPVSKRPSGRHICEPVWLWMPGVSDTPILGYYDKQRQKFMRPFFGGGNDEVGMFVKKWTYAYPPEPPDDEPGIVPIGK